jgi:hypothetical protein
MRTRVLALAVGRDGQRRGRSPLPIRYSACWPGRTREEDEGRRPRRLHPHSSGMVVDDGGEGLCACARAMDAFGAGAGVVESGGLARQSTVSEWIPACFFQWAAVALGRLHAVWCDSMHPQMLVVSVSPSYGVRSDQILWSALIL